MSLELITSTDWGALASTIVAIITSITTVIGGIIAAIQKLKVNKTTAELEETQAELQTTQDFFDPENTEVMTPTESTPDRSWKMSEETKNFLLSGCTDAEKLSVTNQINEAEAAGYVDYKIVVGNGYYNISYGCIIGGVAPTEETVATTETSTAATTATTTASICPIPVNNDKYVEGTRMWKSTFDFAVCDEPTQDAKDYVKSEMQRLDPLNTYPYTISTDKNIYSVHLSMDTYGNDRTAEFGTNCDIIPKHK